MGSEVAAGERGAAALRSPISWALLGLVIQRPSYGYELVQRFERTYGDALELSSPSQIYTALDALERRALIEKLAVEAAGDAVRQPKPHYRATAEGMHGYRGWLIAHLEDERRRSRLFARQLAVLAPGDALTIIEHCERVCLKQASDTKPTAPAGESDGAGGLATRLLLEEDRVAVEAKLAWIEYARREFRALAAGRATAG
jgi:DNA-binding PadR family transcriptional regulator